MFEPIGLEDFEGRTGIVPNFTARATKIVSLRDLTHGLITSIQVMPKDYLDQLLRSVTLEGNKECRPFAECEISLARMDPNELVVGQTFIQRGKYQGLLEDFGNLLDASFCVTRGTAKRNAMIVYGQTRNGEEALAHYIPPIIEVTNGAQFLLDGVHRNFLVKQIGTNIESVLLKGVKAPLPCETGCWSDIKIVDTKPPREQRYYNLQPDLFRNLKWIGIDG